MKSSGSRTRSTLGLAGFLLVLVAALGAQAQPPSSKLPGRKPDAIGREYSVRHPSSVVFLDNVNLYSIVRRGKLGDPERLSELVRLLRPDITDTRLLVLLAGPDALRAARAGGRHHGCPPG